MEYRGSELDATDEFERELKLALERRPAPPSLKRRVLERRSQQRRQHPVLWWRLAASLLLVAILGAGLRWGAERRDEKRRGEEARRQVMTALRITGHALDQVRVRLAEREHEDGE